MRLLYILPAYINGASALQILAAGMLFFTIYTVSSSIAQGLGKPYLPMIILSLGSLFDVGLSVYLVPIYGINGAAAATTVTAFIIMTIIVWKTLQIAEVQLQVKDLIKIIIATGIMGTLLLLIPQSLLFMPIPLNYIFFLFVMLLAIIIYLSVLIIIGGLKKSDTNALYKLGNRLGPFKNYFEKFVDLLDKFVR
jgi:stage V sporulation protein B